MNNTLCIFVDIKQYNNAVLDYKVKEYIQKVIKDTTGREIPLDSFLLCDVTPIITVTERQKVDTEGNYGNVHYRDSVCIKLQLVKPSKIDGNDDKNTTTSSKSGKMETG